MNRHWLSSWNNIASSDTVGAELLAQNKPVQRTSSVSYYSYRRQQFPVLKTSACKSIQCLQMPVPHLLVALLTWPKLLSAPRLFMFEYQLSKDLSMYPSDSNNHI